MRPRIAKPALAAMPLGAAAAGSAPPLPLGPPTAAPPRYGVGVDASAGPKSTRVARCEYVAPEMKTSPPASESVGEYTPASVSVAGS